MEKLKTSIGLSSDVLPDKDENGAALDGTNPRDASLIVQGCHEALLFIRSFREQKRQEVVLAINNIRLPGLAATSDGRTEWRSKSDRTEEAAYTWLRFRLRGPRNSDFEKGWAQLIDSAHSHFSLPSRVSLSLPGELIALPTNVVPEAEDTRCRFDFLAVKQPTRPDQKLEMGEAVYPLEVGGGGPVRNGEIVEIDNNNPRGP